MFKILSLVDSAVQFMDQELIPCRYTYVAVVLVAVRLALRGFGWRDKIVPQVGLRIDF